MSEDEWKRAEGEGTLEDSLSGMKPNLSLSIETVGERR